MDVYFTHLHTQSPKTLLLIALDFNVWINTNTNIHHQLKHYSWTTYHRQHISAALEAHAKSLEKWKIRPMKIAIHENFILKLSGLPCIEKLHPYSYPQIFRGYPWIYIYIYIHIHICRVHVSPEYPQAQMFSTSVGYNTYYRNIDIDTTFGIKVSKQVRKVFPFRQ